MVKGGSELRKLFLTLLAACLTFAGPTYVVFLLEKLESPHPFLKVLGFILFLVGLALFLVVVKGKGGASS